MPAIRQHAAPDRALLQGARRRLLLTLAGVLIAYGVIGGRLILLAMRSPPASKTTLSEPPALRPDIVDRHGQLLATDTAVDSLYADPGLVLDLDEAVEKVSAALAGSDAAELRKLLGDKSRRFVWVARGLSPRQAKRVHDLGLPGFAFRKEAKRLYPMGPLTGHIVGSVNVDHRGIGGIERAIDEGLEMQTPAPTQRAAVRLALDIGVQHAVAAELNAALRRFGAKAAAGLVLDADRGELLAAVSLPEVDPAHAPDWLDPQRVDRVMAGTFELGSIFKALTVAMALDAGIADLDKMYDVRQPLLAPPYRITDLHPQGRPLSVREIFLHSSNVGAGMMALEVGSERQRAFLDRIGFLQSLRTETGNVAAPQWPREWGRSETITIGYGYGLALAPLHFAAGFASLINGGNRVVPTLLQREGTEHQMRARIVSAQTSATMRELLRLNVTSRAGTGRRAEVAGYLVGGKTGTAEMPSRTGYRAQAVIASFVAAFPMDAPRYVTLIAVFEPQSGDGGAREHVTAAVTAAPASARIIERIAPLLGVLPRPVESAGRPRV